MKKIRAIQVIVIFTVLILAGEMVFAQSRPSVRIQMPNLDFSQVVRDMLSKFHPAFLAAIGFGLTIWAIAKVYKEFKSFGQPENKREIFEERKRKKAQERLSDHFKHESDIFRLEGEAYQRSEAKKRYEAQMDDWYAAENNGRRSEREESDRLNDEAVDWYDRDYKY